MNKFLKVCLWTIVLTPLIVDKSVFFPYITGESFFLRGLLILTSILFLFNFFYAQKFREKIKEKIYIFLKNPILLSILTFIFICILSAIFAVDKHIAFWGNIERAEGLVGIIFFFSFFVFSLLTFEKKDWLWFFKLSLFTTFVLLFKEFAQFFGKVARPGSFMSNPSFLAGYLLFSILCSLIIFAETKNKFWKYFSICLLVLSAFGIFITQTRGAIVGVFLGIVAVLFYVIFQKRDNPLSKENNVSQVSFNFNFRKLSIIILGLLIVFSAIFIPTRKSEIWQKIPGLERIALISDKDTTTGTRLLNAKLSLEAVNPVQNSWKKFLLGWGPENFSLAYGRYFNPEQFKYETTWFDRAHNKLLDVLVMNGLLGLIAYLSIWFLFIKSIFKKKSLDLPSNHDRKNQISLVNIGLIFFAFSFFVYLLFFFDQINTYIPFFAVLSFVIFFTSQNGSDKKTINDKRNREAGKMREISVTVFFLILAFFLCFVFFREDLPAYFQMKKYISLMEENNLQNISSKIDSVFEPFTTAQMNIRENFLMINAENYNPDNKTISDLSDLAFLKAEEYAKKEPLDITFLAHLAESYTTAGNNSDDPLLLGKGEEYDRRVLALAPERPDFDYNLATNLMYQKRYDESFSYFEKVFSTKESLFPQNKKLIEEIYPIFLQYFYQTGDKTDYTKAANRLQINSTLTPK